MKRAADAPKCYCGKGCTGQPSTSNPLVRSPEDAEKWWMDRNGLTSLPVAQAIDDERPNGPRTLTEEEKESRKIAKQREGEALAYVRDYRGTWGLPLDIRSDRRFGSKWMKLTERQVDALLAGKARDAARADTEEIMREWWQADQYLQSINPVKPTAERAIAKPAEDGVYQTSDGRIFKVKKAKVQGSGRPYALEFNPNTQSWDYARGMQYRLTEADRMTMEQAEQFGRLYGKCVNCGRTLTDEVSIARAMGPICAGRFAA